MTDQFSRRDVNRALLVNAFALLSVGAGAFIPKPTPLFDFAIAGGSFHGLQDVVEDLALGERLLLRPEPDNPHDPNAVAVDRAGGLMLGYVPREANQPIAALLARGRRIEAEIIARLNVRRFADIPEDLVFTGLASGDPRIRLILRG